MKRAHDANMKKVPLKNVEGGEDESLFGARPVGNSTLRLESIYHLSKDLSEWKMLGQNMKIGRASHVAMLIPESLISCNNKHDTV